MKKIQLTLMLACALWLCAATPAHAAGSGWLTTQWWVFCTDAAEQQQDPDDCDDAGSGAASFATRDLEAGSQWLASLGFRAPRVAHQSEGGQDRYVAWITGADELPGTARYDGSDLFISPYYFFAMGAGEQALLEDSYRLGAPIHELFHAIQNAYDNPVPFLDSHRWIGEGMAQAVLYSWLRRAGHAHSPVETRHWDIALSRPECKVTKKEKKLGCYATQRFWTWLGQHLGSTDDIQYLHSILAQNLKPDRGITGTDQGLRAFDPEGLYNLYPEFVAQFATDSKQYKNAPEIALPYQKGKTVEKTVSGKAQEVAASAHQVSIDVPEGETAGLKIEFERDHENLHLVVDGERVDLPPGKRRNVFRATISSNGPDAPRLIRVVNVAPDAGKTQARKYTLKLTLAPLDPCSAPAMDSALNLHLPSNLPGLGSLGSARELFRVESFDPTGRMRPNGDSTISFSGLIGDSGAACTDNIGQLTQMGAQASGVEANPGDMKDKATALMQQLAGDGSGTDSGDTPNVMGLIASMQELMAAPQGSRDVIIHVYSPHVFTFMTGMTPPPPVYTQHGGLGGWQANAAANLVLQLKGTQADDLDEGQTYEAVAVAPTDDDDTDHLGAIPTLAGFYTSWQGKLHIATFVAGFEGTWKILSGRLTGTVTIDKMTGATISGSYNLSGQGRLLTEQYKFSYDEDGRVDGSDRVQGTTTDGPITMKGSFSAPNTYSSPVGQALNMYHPIIVK